MNAIYKTLLLFAMLLPGICNGYSQVIPGSISPATQSIESWDNVTLTHTGSAGVTSRQWQQSSDGGSTWTNISRATGTSYNTGGLGNAGATNIIRKYRVRINGQDIYSAESVITVLASIIPGSISPAEQTVNAGGSLTLTHTGANGINWRQWQQSTDNGTTWTNISNANSETYNTGILANSGATSIIRRYRLQINSQSIYSAEAVITVNGSGGSVIPGTVTPAAQTIASGGSVDLTHSGSTGVTTRQWQQSIDNGNNWTDIPGATSSTCNTGTLANSGSTSITRRYRVKINGQAVYSAESVITVSGSTGSITPGIISPASQTVETWDKVSMTHTGSSGVTSRQWQLSTDGGSSWTNISGATSTTCNTGTLSNTGAVDIIRKYRVKVNGQDLYSAESVITVSASIIPGSISPSAQTIAPGGSVTLAHTGSDGINWRQWQQSTDNGASWANIPSATSSTCNTGTLSNSGSTDITRRYRIQINAQEIYSAEAVITISGSGGSITPGSISPITQTIASGGSLTLTHSGGTGITSRLWQQSTDGGTTWTDLSGNTGTTFNTGAISNSGSSAITRKFRVKINGQAIYSAEAAITISVAVIPGTVTPAAQTIASGGSLTLTHSGGTGITSRLWQQSTDSGTTWTDLSGNTGTTYNTGAITNTGSSAITRKFRVKINGQAVYSAESVITISVAVTPGTVTPAAQTIASGGSLTLTHSGGTGITSRLWQQSDNGSTWTDIPSATAATHNTGAITNTGSSDITRKFRVKINGQAIYSAEAVITINGKEPEEDNPTHSGGITLVTRYEYDHAGRLLTVKQDINNSGEVTVAENQYNELGQLYKTRLHQIPGSSGPIDQMEYAYNIRGWITGITGGQFSEKLHYHDVAGGLGNAPQWGGNISAMEWNTPATGTSDWHAYKYAYNNLGMLTDGNYSRSSTAGSGYGTNAGHYDTHYDYDIMGNIRGLTRRHGNTLIDDLEYAYPAGGSNRPQQIRDRENNSLGFAGTSNFTYDPAGRMAEDSQKGAVAYNHLNLPTTVTKGTDVLKYTYDAAGRRLKRQFKTETARYYVAGAEYEGGKLKFIATDYGRIRNEMSGWVYDYFLKDHLGNIRVVLSADPVAMQAGNRIVYMATMEEGASPNPSQGGETAASEGLYFANLESTRADKPYNYPDHNPLNQKVAKVPGKSRGPSIMLQVMAGDTIEISAKAFYNMDKTLPGQGVDIAPVLGSAIAAMTNPTGAMLDEAAQLALDLGAEASQSVALVQVPEKNNDNNDVKPESGINFVLYSGENFEAVQANTGVMLVEDKINTIQTLATDRMVMTQAGFLEVFVNNEAQTPVYFDNLMVTQSTSSVKEVNAYYPYGMIIGGLSTQVAGNAYNGYKYNGKELQTQMTLNWLDYGARMRDLDVVPWMVPDPLAEKYYHQSPYMFCGGNPINFIDPNGEDYWSTSDPLEIERMLRMLQSVGGSESFNYESWTHVTDEEFMGKLTYNDQTRKFYTSYGTIDESGDVVIHGVSFQAAGGIHIDGFAAVRQHDVMALDPPGLVNIYPEGAVVGGTKAGWGLLKYMWNQMTKPVSTINTIDASKSATAAAATPTAPRTIETMSQHSVNQAITRGFKTEDILKIVKEGRPQYVNGRYGAQWKYMLNGNTVVVNASNNRVITVFSNVPGTANGMGAGTINSF